MPAQLLRALLPKEPTGPDAPPEVPGADNGQLSQLTILANHWAKGRLPAWYYHLTGGATLLAAAVKKHRADGEAPECRPVVVGDVLRRTFDRVVLLQSWRAVVPALLPQQLGVGVPSGCQKQIWIARILHDMITAAAEREKEVIEADTQADGDTDQHADFDTADWICMKLDQKNAHNSCIPEGFARSYFVTLGS